jgi:cytochrome c-type biogenesis protein CcmH/NrfG
VRSPAEIRPDGPAPVRRAPPAPRPAEEAIGWLEQLVRLQPEDLNAGMMLADACAGAGRLGDAIAAAERALDPRPRPAERSPRRCDPEASRAAPRRLADAESEATLIARAPIRSRW